MVDEKENCLQSRCGVVLSGRSPTADFLEAMNDTQNAPSLSQAQRLKKKLAQEGALLV